MLYFSTGIWFLCLPVRVLLNVWRKKELAVPLLYIYDLTLFICDTSTYEQISYVKDAQIVRYCYVTRSLYKYLLMIHS